MSLTKQETIIPEFIKKAIDSEIERVVNEEMELTKKYIEKKKAEIVAGVLLRVYKEISIDTLGEKITFEVKMK